MKTINTWLEEYGESHKNSTNKLIHWICVPAIFWSIIALISLIPNTMLQFSDNEIINIFSNWGTVVLILGLLFYIRLSFTVFIGMLVFSTIVLIDIYFTKLWGDTINSNFTLYLAILIFILAWIGQFIGHNIEGKKPSFLKDLQFLLIGPAWLLCKIYKKIGIKY